MKPEEFMPVTEDPTQDQADIVARKQRTASLQAIGQKMQDVNNIFNDAKRMGDTQTAQAARQKLAQLAKQKQDLMKIPGAMSTGSQQLNSSQNNDPHPSFTKIAARRKSDGQVGHIANIMHGVALFVPHNTGHEELQLVTNLEKAQPQQMGEEEVDEAGLQSMGHVSGAGAKQRALNLARKLSRETVNDYVVLDDGSESFTILTAKDAQSLNLGSQYKVLETTAVTESDGGGTCSSAIAAGPAQNLLATPKKKKKQSKIGEACSKVNEKHQDQPDNEFAGLRKKKKKVSEEFNPQDIIKMDVPLFIRMLEYAKEDAKTDMDLHNVTEKLIQLSSSSEALGMDQYDAIVGGQVTESGLNELDNGPKGKEHSDNLNYDKRRNMTGTYVNKDDLAKRKSDNAWAAELRKMQKQRDAREQAKKKNVVARLVQMGEPMVADWSSEGGYDGVRDGIIDMANDEGIHWTTKDIDKVLAHWGVEKEDEQEIPKFDSDKPTTPLEKKAQDAMWRVWNDIAPDLQSMHGAHAFERDFLNPYAVAEVCVDASRLQTNGELSDAEEAEVLKLDDKTLARLCSRFGF